MFQLRHTKRLKPLYQHVSYFSTSPIRSLDLVLCVDLTKSMEPFVQAAQTTLHIICGGIIDEKIDLRLGVVGYRDYFPDNYDGKRENLPFGGDEPPKKRGSFGPISAWKNHKDAKKRKQDGVGPFPSSEQAGEISAFEFYDFTTDTTEMEFFVNRLATLEHNNTDVCEAVLTGLRVGVEDLSWNEKTAKIILLAGDAPPHGVGGHAIKTFDGIPGDNFPQGDPCKWTVEDVIQQCRQQNITIMSLGLLPSLNRHWDQLTRNSFAYLAHQTGGEYYDCRSAEAAMKMLDKILKKVRTDMEKDEIILTFTQMGLKKPNDIAMRMGMTKEEVEKSLKRLAGRKLISW